MAGLNSIRGENVANKILVEGTKWSGMHSWFDHPTDGGDSNAEAFQGLSQDDPNANVPLRCTNILIPIIVEKKKHA